MKILRLSVIALGLAAFAMVPSEASVTAGTNLFGRGRMRISAYGGAASALNQTYALLGLGAGYFLTNGLEVGVDGEAWVGNDPNIYKLTPQVRYVFYRAQRIIPYLGAFYRRTYYESLSDLDSYGGRLGVYTPLGGKGYAGVGMVYEKLVDCNKEIYSDCTSQYPEFSVSIGF